MGIKLQSIVPLNDGAPKIDYNSRILLMGSCFSESIGEKLQYYKFDASINPFGIIFNPHSLARLISRTISEETFEENDVFEHQGIWKSFEVHSQWSHTDRDSLLKNLNNKRIWLREYIKSTSHVIITLGTAWVYRYNKAKNIVANCHKVAATEFTKELLSVKDIEESLVVMVSELRKLNPNLKFLLTLSPVRHLKDGFVENSRSKARLMDAIQQFCQSDADVDYFPAYEIVMDELRDYRFFKQDLVHPNELAVDYIWEKFRKVWLHPSSEPIMEKVGKIQKSLAHKPLNPEIASTAEFEKKLSEKIKELQGLLPGIQFDS